MKNFCILMILFPILISSLTGCNSASIDSTPDIISPSVGGEYSDDFGGQSPDKPIAADDSELDPSSSGGLQDVSLPPEAYNPVISSLQLSEDFGSTRENPYPLNTYIETPSWNFRVLQVMRGQTAWERILQDDPNSLPPPSGYEYVLVNINMANKIIDDQARSFSLSDIAIVGDMGILRTDRLWGTPRLDFYFKDIYCAESLTGWMDVIVPIDEENLLLAINLNDWLIMEGSTERLNHYIALEEGAAYVPPPVDSISPPNNLGTDPSQPVPFGTTVITDKWEVTVLDVLRGDDALSYLLAANERNPEPNDGFEYIVARLRMHYRRTNDETSYDYMDNDFFSAYSTAQGLLPALDIWVSTDQRYNWMNATFYPGGTLEAWTGIQVPIGETNPVLVFTKQQPIYLALQ